MSEKGSLTLPVAGTATGEPGPQDVEDDAYNVGGYDAGEAEQKTDYQRVIIEISHG